MVKTKRVGALDMPMLGFGTFQMRGDVCEKAVACALSEGYRMIDTAAAYGNEEAVGAAIKSSDVPRSDILITTKVNFSSYENARASVEKSLGLLGTDYLDLVLLHWPFGNYYAAWRVLEEMKREGKIREIGVSNFDPDRLIDLSHFNSEVPVINQTETHLYCQRLREHSYESALGVAHEAYAPLGQSRANEMFDEPAVRAVMERAGKTPAQVLLRFLVDSDVIAIPKSARAERIRENFGIFDFSLTEDELSALRSLDKASPMIGRAEDPEFAKVAVTW
ncbi:MAG: aldo/keto reductase [Clostridiales bacterium]|nr:aldo/keto reductase [Clostridiales bacterium]MDY4435664.1 aldo/keto reductase [Candidatus Flemingibacterium sp.]